VKVFKKIITVFCIFAISISCVVPAFAVDTSTNRTFWEFVVDYASGKFGADNVVAWWKNLTGQSGYEAYTADMQKNLGTTLVGSKGFYIPLNLTFSSASRYASTHHETVTKNHIVGDFAPQSTYSATVDYNVAGLLAPVAGKYSIIFAGSTGSPNLPNLPITVKNAYYNSTVLGLVRDEGFRNSGDQVLSLSSDGLGVHYFHISGSADQSVVYDLTFFCFVEPSAVQAATVSDTRTGSLCGNYTYTGDNGTQVIAENVYLMDEANKKVNNPATGATYNVTDWQYDYSTRTYNYTTDNSTYKSGTVSYGDDNACVKLTDSNGNTITYNYYYGTTSGGSGTGGGTVTPDTPSGGIGGLIEKLLATVGDVVKGIISGVLKLLTKGVEALGGIFDLFKALGEKIVGIFGGFTSFLTAVFPFLPPEFFTILNLGLILLIAAAVIRRILGR